MKTNRNIPSKLLGVAVGDKSMLVAEVVSNGGRYQVTKVGQFTYAAGQSFQQPQQLGESFGKFLKDNGFAVRKAVFGLPAKWVLSKAREIPAADERTACSMLRLQAESEFSPELKDLVFDFAGTTSTSEERSVLLLATPGKNIEQIKDMADAAKVGVEAVTVSVSALANASARVKKDSLVLSMGPGGTELGAQPSFGPSVLRHVGPASAAAAPMLLGELRRATSAPANSGINGKGVNGNGRAQRELILWDDADPSESPVASALAACRTMGESAGLTVTDGDLATLGVTGGQAGGRGAAIAVAVALEAMQGHLSIDFMHSRLAAPKESKYDPRIVWGVAAAVLLIGTYVAGSVVQRNLDKQVAQKKAIVAGDAANVKLIAEQNDRIKVIKDFHPDNPHILECIREIQASFPDSRDLYASRISLRQEKNGELKGSLAGKCSASNAAPAVALLAKVRANPHFSNVIGDMSEPENREASFTINFGYVTPDVQAGAAAAATQARPAARTSTVRTR